LSSSILKWPDRREVDRAVREWAAREAGRHPGLVRLGYFGSYARGDWGVGSDLDLLAVVETCGEPFERRGLAWDLSGLPVPAEILVYTVAEWDALPSAAGRFAQSLAEQGVWVHPPEEPAAPEPSRRRLP
jgi:predicted nucleotidyltransferase